MQIGQYELQTEQLEVKPEQFQEVEVILRSSSRQPQVSIKLNDYITYTVKYPI
jgi:hypothetical protein